ncbi:hypothetical protein AB0903_25900 [Streptomyces sp. NPDC048389]
MPSPFIRSFSQLESLDPGRPVVTLFSGGLDSSYLLLRLAAWASARCTP